MNYTCWTGNELVGTRDFGLNSGKQASKEGLHNEGEKGKRSMSVSDVFWLTSVEVIRPTSDMTIFLMTFYSQHHLKNPN